MARKIRVFDSYIAYEYDDIDPEEIWDPDGPAFQWAQKTSAVLEVEAKRTAPGLPGSSHARWRGRASSGNLRRGISAFGLRTGPESYNLTLLSTAYYSEWVHGGTAYARGAYIYSDWGWANRAFIAANEAFWAEGNIDDRGQATGEGRFSILPIPGKAFMKLPPGAGQTRKYHLRVRGQLANAFLYRAWNRTNEDLARGEMGELIQPVGYVRPPGVGLRS